MTSWPRFRVFTGALALALLFICLPQGAAAQDDPPTRVARVRSIQGSVSFEPAGTDDWGAAEVNRPITTGDKVWSDQDSRAELNFGTASIRLGSQTAFTFLNLTDQIAQISVNEGTVDVHVRALGDQETFEIDTPNLAFSVLRPGDYRLGVDENGDTSIVTIRAGQGEITGGGQAFNMGPNETGTFVGTDQLTPDIGTAMPPDDFDGWCNDLNAGEDRPPRYVPPDVIGAEDLEGYGAWQNVPEYGQVWVPSGVAVGWAPYSYGHWAWVSPWGWTWVDAAPWGFAPFHYGRWVQVGGAWAWTPGPVVVGVRPVYAPALVAWVGGPHFGLSLSVGGVVGAGVAWFPLGPREVYVPPYTVSRAYVTNVNITNTVVERTTVVNVYNNYTTNHVTNVTYVNQTHVIATSQTAFTSAQPVSRNLAQVNAAQIAKAPIGTGAGAGIAPQPRSAFGAAAPSMAVAHPPAAVIAHPIVAKTQPPPPAPSFAAQAKAIQTNGGRPLAPAQMKTIAPAPAARAQAQVRIAPVAAKPTPVSVKSTPPPMPANRPAPAAPANANRPAPTPAPAPAAKPSPAPAPASKPAPAMSNPPARADRPPAAQPAAKAPAPAPAPAPANNANKPAAQPPAKRPVITNDDIKPAPKPSEPAPEAKPAPAPPKPATNPNRPPAAQPAPKPAAKPAENPNRPPAEQPKTTTPPPKSNSSDKPPKKEKDKPEKPEKEKP